MINALYEHFPHLLVRLNFFFSSKSLTFHSGLSENELGTVALILYLYLQLYLWIQLYFHPKFQHAFEILLVDRLNQFLGECSKRFISEWPDLNISYRFILSKFSWMIIVYITVRWSAGSAYVTHSQDGIRSRLFSKIKVTIKCDIRWFIHLGRSLFWQSFEDTISMEYVLGSCTPMWW